MSAWDNGWEGDDVDFGDDADLTAEENHERTVSQGLVLTGRSDESVNDLKYDKQTIEEKQQILEAKLKFDAESLFSSSLNVNEEDGWNDQYLDDICQDEGWGDEIEIEKNPEKQELEESNTFHEEELKKMPGVSTPIAASVAPDRIRNKTEIHNESNKLEMNKIKSNSNTGNDKLDATFLSEEEEEKSGWDDDGAFDDFDLSTTSTQEATNAGEEMKEQFEVDNNTLEKPDANEDGWKQDDIDIGDEDFSNDVQQRAQQPTGSASVISFQMQLQTPRTSISTIHESRPVLSESLMLSGLRIESDRQDSRLNNSVLSNHQPTPAQQEIDESLLVDQVPLEASPPVPRRDSTAAIESDRSGTLGEETLDGQYFGPVVDHLPASGSLVPENALSVAAQARYEDLDQDSKEVGEDTEPGQTSEEENTKMTTGAPSVVDHVPTTNSDGIGILRDSIFAVASQQSSPVMEDIWREDFDPNDEDYGPVVDQLPPSQTPTPSVRSIRSHASLAVHGAIAEEDENDEDRIEKPKFGIFSEVSVADSIVVVAPIAEQQDEDNTVEQTVDGTMDGTLDGIADDETVSNAPPTLDVQNEPLVDHVPLRREGRPADNSTLVLVDQSEFSTVGDITYEDVQYGPVVDHTPPPMSTSWQATAAASVIVAATKSECPDDLEDDIDGETYAMGTGDDGVTLETSLGDQNTPDDKLVDHVPEPSSMRRVNSSSAIAEAQSVMSIRDDEFGLVVDQTPIPPIGTAPLTRDSVGALAPLSEGETLRSDEITSVPGSSVGQRVEVDKVPAPSSRSRADSVFTAKSVSESDVDTLDGMPALDEFGPVVDHLPPARSALSLSRGGSASGALATLSEANFDGDSADAEIERWEEDEQELQDVITTLTEEEIQQDTPETRNKSVTFQSLEDAPVFPLSDEISKQQDLPRSRFTTINSIEDREVNSGLNIKASPNNNSYSIVRQTSEEAASVDSPGVEKVLLSSGERKRVGAKRITIDDTLAVVDFEKLLQDEVTKRMLLEKEIEIYQAKVKSFHVSTKKPKNQNVRDRNEIDMLEKSITDLSNKLKCKVDETAVLRRKIVAMQNQILDLRNHESRIITLEVNNKNISEELFREKDKSISMERKNKSLASSEIKLKAEILHLKRKCQEEEDVYRQQQEKEKAITSDLDNLKDDQKGILQKLKKCEEFIQQLKHEKAIVEDNLKASYEEIADTQELKSQWKIKESKYSKEISKLQEKISSNFQLSEKIKTLQEELHTKCHDVESLRQMLQDNKIKFEQSQSSQNELVISLERRANQLEEELQLMKDNHLKEIEAYTKNETDYRRELNEAISALDTMSEEKAELENHTQKFEEVTKNHNEFVELVSDLKDQQAVMKETISSYSMKVKKLQSENDALIAEKANNDKVELKAELERNKIMQINLEAKHNEEKRILIEELQQVKSEMQKLKAQIMENSPQDEIVESLRVDLDESVKLVESKSQEVVKVKSCLESHLVQSEQVTQERNQLLDSCDHLQGVISVLKEEKDEANYSIIKIKDQLQLTNEELQAALDQLSIKDNAESRMRSEIKKLSEEREVLLHEKIEVESEGEEMLVQLGLLKEQMDARDKEISDLHAALRSSEEVSIQTGDNFRDAAERIRRIEENNLDLREHQEEVQVLHKKELDAKDREITALRDALRNSETTNIRTTDCLRDAQGRIRQLEKVDTETQVEQKDSLFHLNAENPHLLRSMKQLTVENADLKQQVDDLTSAKVFIEEELREYRAKKEGINATHQDGERSESLALKEMSKIIDDLNEKLHSSITISNEKEIELKQMEEIYERIEDELKTTKIKLINTEEILLRKGGDSNQQEDEDNKDENDIISKDDYRRLLAKANATIFAREQSLRRVQSIFSNLEMRLLSLIKIQQESTNDKKNEKNKMNKIERSKKEILIPEEKEAIEGELTILKIAMQEEKTKMNNLDKQLSTMLLELSTTKNLLSCKEEELERASLELDETRAEQLEVTQKVTAQILESDISIEEAEQVDNMRDLIISLSQALEKSETRRADAIERLLRERKTNADSLKRLGASVKRFYVTLNSTNIKN